MKISTISDLLLKEIPYQPDRCRAHIILHGVISARKDVKFAVFHDFMESFCVVVRNDRILF